MLDTVGAEMQVVNKTEKAISLQQDANVILTPDKGQEASSQVLPINFNGLAKVKMLLSNFSLIFAYVLLSILFLTQAIDVIHVIVAQ